MNKTEGATAYLTVAPSSSGAVRSRTAVRNNVASDFYVCSRMDLDAEPGTCAIRHASQDLICLKFRSGEWQHPLELSLCAWRPPPTQGTLGLVVPSELGSGPKAVVVTVGNCGFSVRF